MLLSCRCDSVLTSPVGFKFYFESGKHDESKSMTRCWTLARLWPDSGWLTARCGRVLRPRHRQQKTWTNTKVKSGTSSFIRVVYWTDFLPTCQNKRNFTCDVMFVMRTSAQLMFGLRGLWLVQVGATATAPGNSCQSAPVVMWQETRWALIKTRRQQKTKQWTTIKHLLIIFLKHNSQSFLVSASGFFFLSLDLILEWDEFNKPKWWKGQRSMSND